MYATVRAYQGNTDLADALVENESEVRRILGEIDGFRAYYLIKLAEGTTTVSVFDSQAAAEESTRVAAAWLAENLPDLGATPYVTAARSASGRSSTRSRSGRWRTSSSPSCRGGLARRRSRTPGSSSL